jgi:hypothetical protein
MGWVWVSLALLVGLGCAGGPVSGLLRWAGPPPPPRAAAPVPPTVAPPDCPFLSIYVSASKGGTNMSDRDAEVGARIAELMGAELTRRGLSVVEDSGDAFWSLMVMALASREGEGFIFSAMLSTRGGFADEAGPSGVVVFGDAGEGAAPNSYNGLAYGSSRTLESSAQEYVRQADAAVLSHARGRCQIANSDLDREQGVDLQLPAPDLPL